MKGYVFQKLEIKGYVKVAAPNSDSKKACLHAAVQGEARPWASQSDVPVLLPIEPIERVSLGLF